MPTKKPVNKPKAKPAPKPAAKPVSKAAPRKAVPAAKAKPAAKPAAKAAPKSKAPAPKAPASKAKPAKTPPAAAAKAPAKAPAKPTVKATPAPVSKSPAKASPKAVPAAKPAAAPKPVKAEKTAPAPAPAHVPAAVAAKLAAKPAPAAKPAAPAVKQVVATGTMRAGPRPVRTDEDDEGSLNLLSGPRNVQPYQVRKGEEYMSKEQLNHFRTILETWKQDLMEEVDRTVTHMKDEAANPPDPNDRATLESEFSLELRTRDRERKLIRKIDEAIKRIEDGSYGYCLETGEEIGVKRLEARPVATLCLEAQERRERREKQYGDRDDRYRG